MKVPLTVTRAYRVLVVLSTWARVDLLIMVRARAILLFMAVLVPSTALQRHASLPSCHRRLAARRAVTARIVTPSPAGALAAAAVSVVVGAKVAGAATLATTAVALPSIPPLSVS